MLQRLQAGGRAVAGDKRRGQPQQRDGVGGLGHLAFLDRGQIVGGRLQRRSGARLEQQGRSGQTDAHRRVDGGHFRRQGLEQAARRGGIDRPVRHAQQQRPGQHLLRLPVARFHAGPQPVGGRVGAQPVVAAGLGPVRELRLRLLLGLLRRDAGAGRRQPGG